MVQPGQKAPDFSAQAVVGKSFKKVSLSDYKGKYVVLFFYPLDFTFVCPTEITSFSDRTAEFEAINTQVLGVSVDSQFSHLAWIETPRNKGGLGDINYPLIADMTKSISRDYGVLLEDAGISLRGVFIIDPDGNMQISMINANNVGRNISEVLRLVKALQYSAQNGEVCPANWEPGSATITPDVDKAKDYFSKHG